MFGAKEILKGKISFIEVNMARVINTIFSRIETKICTLGYRVSQEYTRFGSMIELVGGIRFEPREAKDIRRYGVYCSWDLF